MKSLDEENLGVLGVPALLLSNNTHDVAGTLTMYDRPTSDQTEPGKIIHLAIDTYLVSIFADGTYQSLGGFHWGGDIGANGLLTVSPVLESLRPGDIKNKGEDGLPGDKNAFPLRPYTPHK